MALALALAIGRVVILLKGLIEMLPRPWRNTKYMNNQAEEAIIHNLNFMPPSAITFQIIVLQSLTPTDAGHAIALRDGRTLLVSRSTPSYAAITPTLQLALKRSKPVAVALDAKGAVVKALLAQQAKTVSLQVDTQNPATEVVTFENMAGRYRLEKGDPAAPAIRAYLQQSIATKKPVWFVNHVKSGKLVAATHAE